MLRQFAHAAAVSAALVCAPVVSLADASFARLYDLLEIDTYLEISRSEGLRDFPGLAEDMLGQPPDTVLSQQAQDIYQAERMRSVVERTMQDMLSETDIRGALLFLGSETGLRIIELELAARRAMSDPTIEEAARAAWGLAEEDQPWLVARIAEVIAASDLVERNVAGALNSNLRFYAGLSDGGGLDMSEAEQLAQVWSQEPAIRTDTADWLNGYLLLAYQSVTEDEMANYITFWRTPPGKALNAAMFAGFNQLYDEISYTTGRVLALRVGSQDL